MKCFIPFTFLVLLLSSLSLFSQELPDPSKLPSSKEEFIKSEKDIISTINSLESSTLDLEDDRRKRVNAYVLAWITNSPTVTVTVDSKTVTFTKKNNGLLVIFLGGWTKYVLENNYSKDNIKATLAGIQSVIKVYKAGHGIKRDKEMEKLIVLNDEGTLEKWITDRLASK